ncbi:MAG: cyclophilin family peptidyl-prolyl cis-trans isomerase [Candidatus Paceibacteria bacterium]|jgi:peptidyl-prolyl cis-trans isomerase A (cyclophilin A)
MKNFLTIIISLIVVAGLLYVVIKPKADAPTTPKAVVETALIKTEAPSEQVQQKQETMKATFTTNKGTFELELFADLAPKTVENFVTLAESDFYNDVKFHRVIAGFMIQGGDPLSKDDDMQDRWGTGGPGYQFEDEIHAANNNAIGTISMANSGPNTNGSQFFINTANNDFLDTKHTVFGKIVSGMEVITAIEAVEKFPNDRPVEAVVIESVSIEK